MQISLGNIFFTLIMISQTLYAYTFTMHLDKTQPMIGEKCILTLDFSYQDLEEYEIEVPLFENVDVILLDEKESQDKNGTWHVIVGYQLIPYKAGATKLTPLKTHIEMIEKRYQERYNKNKYLQKFDIFTEPIVIDIQPLPQDLTVTGDYQLYAYIDKNNTLIGKPIHFTLKIKGEGNIPNLDFFTLNIPNTTIYEKTISEDEKSFDILSNTSFTIPPILLKYYNQTTKQISLLSTAPFEIIVTGGKTKKESFKFFLWWLIGLSVLFLVTVCLLCQLFSYDAKKAFKKKLKRTKTKEALLKKIMPYLHKNRQLSRLIYELEEVEDKSFKRLKKKILEHF